MTMRRKEKIILLTALACTVGLGVWSLYSWLYIGPEKAIERELAKIRARGEPVTLEELAPPEIPDAENAALIYEQAFAQYYEPPGEEGRKLSDISHKDTATWTEEDTKAVKEDLEKNQDCLRLIHDAANYDKCRFPLDYTPGYGMLLGHLNKMRSCARPLARDALLKAKEGRIDEALESVWAGLRLGKALLDEPIVGSQFVRYATDGLVFAALERILDEDDASPEILRRLLKELDVQESREAFARCVQGQRCFQIDIYEKVIKDPALLAQMQRPGGGLQFSVARKGYRIMGVLGRPVLTRDEIFGLSIMRRMIDLSKLPYYKAKADLDKLEQDMRSPPFYRLLSTMLLSSTRSHLHEARNEVKIGLAQLALGLKIFKAKNAKYPDSLSELVPDILSELPQDPFTGRDFVYKREAEGFLVYSLGENGTDEGGKWDEKKRYQHDLPWRSQR